MRFAVLLTTTVVVLSPLGVVVGTAVATPAYGSYRYPLGNIVDAIASTRALQWLENSLVVTIATTAVTIVLAAPGGYVLSRARGRFAGRHAIVLFFVQSVPVIAVVIPLFFLFARLGAVDTLGALVIVYAGITVAVATWMLSSYFDTIPVGLEEAAWVDGAGRLTSFIRIVLPNALPGVLSVAVFSFLLAWNDFLIGLVFLRSVENFIAPVGLLGVFEPGARMGVATLIMVPPVLVFGLLHRHFSAGGLEGSLAGR